MKYLVRLNPKARNPLTGRVDPSRVWEVEQTANKDSKSVTWHCHDVVIRTNGHDVPIRFVVSEQYANASNLQKDKKVEMEFWGIAVRGLDDSIVIQTGRHDVV